ncbi:unnamed protein product [Symbiodinium sp. KB8]|nr:unnamed protein product [Symbiodinium sp. KB8]
MRGMLSAIRSDFPWGCRQRWFKLLTLGASWPGRQKALVKGRHCKKFLTLDFQLRRIVDFLLGENLGPGDVKNLGPLGLRFVEGLRGPALHIVKAVKEEVLVSDKGPLWEPCGLDTSKKPESSTSLDPEHGVLSRQLGDPMSTYTMRRRSWYAMLTDLDSEIKLPELLLAEQILMNAGVTEEHLLMIKTSLGQIITVDGVCNELLNQHGNIPQRENKAKVGGGPSCYADAGGNEDWYDYTGEAYTDYGDQGCDTHSPSLGGYEDETASGDLGSEGHGILEHEYEEAEESAEHAADIIQAEAIREGQAHSFVCLDFVYDPRNNPGGPLPASTLRDAARAAKDLPGRCCSDVLALSASYGGRAGYDLAIAGSYGGCPGDWDKDMLFAALRENCDIVMDHDGPVDRPGPRLIPEPELRTVPVTGAYVDAGREAEDERASRLTKKDTVTAPPGADVPLQESGGVPVPLDKLLGIVTKCAVESTSAVLCTVPVAMAPSANWIGVLSEDFAMIAEANLTAEPDLGDYHMEFLDQRQRGLELGPDEFGVNEEVGGDWTGYTMFFRDADHCQNESQHPLLGKWADLGFGAFDEEKPMALTKGLKSWRLPAFSMPGRGERRGGILKAMIKTLITAHQLSGDMAISLTPLQEAMHHSVDRVDGHLRSRSSGTQLLAPIDHCRHLLDSLRQERKSKELKDQAKKILAFLGTRTEKRYLKKTVNQGAGRELNCNKAGPELRTGLDETRAKAEFEEIKKADPGLLRVIPTRWVDIDKAEVILTMPVRYEWTPLREQRPPWAILLRNVAATQRLIKSGDISAAFLQGSELDRKLVLSMPEGSLPEGTSEDDLVIVSTTVYGAKDAPRGCFKNLGAILRHNNLCRVPMEPGFYVMNGTDNNGDTYIKGLLLVHVGNLLWVGDEDMEAAMGRVQQEYRFGSLHQQNFKLCGSWLKQGSQEIEVSCPDLISRVRPVHLEPLRRGQRENAATEKEKSQLRSVQLLAR